MKDKKAIKKLIKRAKANPNLYNKKDEQISENQSK